MSTFPDLDLTAEMPSATHDAWMTLVAKVLKGADFEKRLVGRTADGIRIEPLSSRRTDTDPVLRRNAGQPWRIAQRVDHPDPATAARLAVADLEGGADALALVFPASRSARGHGIACETVADLDASLTGVMLDIIALRLDPAPAGMINAALVAALVERRRLKPADLAIDFGMDPIGSLIEIGSCTAPSEEMGQRIGETTTHLRSLGFSGPFVTCDTRPYHEAGASEAQELAVALSTGVAYLRALSASGLAVADASRAISWIMAVDADQLLGIAKLRALRKLWARVEQASGVTPQPIRVHTETSWRMLSKRDPAVNMLRTTLATFAAGIGGADSVTVIGYTAPLGLPDASARRIARNTQIVLIEECGLARVADPAAGAGTYEALTDDLCKAAWVLFQDVERAGGIVAGLASGSIQSTIAATQNARMAAIATRKQPLTGTSEFPTLVEVPVNVFDTVAEKRRDLSQHRAGAPDLAFSDLVAAMARGAARSDVASAPMHKFAVQTLPSLRLAEPFETLRDAAEAYRTKMAMHPRVFLASLGTMAEHGPRSSWIANLFAAGGIEAIATEGFTASGPVGLAFAQSGATVACVTGTDEVYGLLGEATIAALKAAGARHVLVAGRPGDLEPGLRGAGADGFIYSGQDVVAVLQDMQRKLGVTG